MDQQAAVGQHMFAGFQGFTIPIEFAQSIRKHKIGNIILFEHNITSHSQLKRLCGELRALVLSATGYPPIITIDQEGGVVSRLREDSTLFPSAMAIAATGKPNNARIAGYITGCELLEAGINLNLTPVMDVNSNPGNPVIGVRSFGDDPLKVSSFGLAMAQGHRDAGIPCCLKHFPGHGDTTVDSHLGLPRVEKSLDALLACELIPFQAGIDAGVPAVMTSHILFPLLEPDDLPATLSRRILTDLLKVRMGFQGLVLSDCMMMDAIARYYGTVNSAVAAIRAGVDLVFVSHSSELAGQSAQAIELALDTGDLDKNEFEVSTQKIIRFKAALPAGPASICEVGSLAHREASACITREAITVVNDAPFKLGSHPLFLGCRLFRPTPVSSVIESPPDFAQSLCALLGGDALTTPSDPSDAEIAQALSEADSHSALVIGLYSARSRPAQLALVREAAKRSIPVCAVALRDPYDLADLPGNIYTIATYDYNERTLVALADVLAGRYPATGTLPVRLR